MEHTQNFDEQIFDEVVVAKFHRRNNKRESLVGKTLANHQPFVRFFILLHHQSFTLHASLKYPQFSYSDINCNLATCAACIIMFYIAIVYTYGYYLHSGYHRHAYQTLECCCPYLNFL